MFYRALRYLCFPILMLASVIGYSQDPCDNNPIVTVPQSFDVATGSATCLDVTVEDFDEILTMQFTLSYDPTVVAFDFVDFGSGNPLNIALTDFGSDPSIGIITLTWFDVNFSGVTVSDNDVIFTLCFNTIGEPGESTDITFNSSVTDIEVSATPNACVVEPVLNNGFISIACDNLYISAGSCPSPAGAMGGSIFFRVCGGNPDYAYTVNPGNITGTRFENQEALITGLAPGVYSISIVDDNGTMNTEMVTVGTGSSISADLDVLNPSCPDRENGSLEIINLTGGQAPYTIEWSNFIFNRNRIELLAAGTYSATITDDLGCNIVLTETIAADPIVVTAVLIQGESCNGANDAIVEFTVSGGTPNGSGEYKINNITGPAVRQFTGLPGGMFSYQIEDFAIPRCQTEIEMIDIPIISNPTLQDNSIEISCNGAKDGFLEVVVQGSSVSNFRYDVVDQSNVAPPGGFSILDTFRVPNICPGIYTVTAIERINENGTIVDGCITTLNIAFADPPPLFFDVITELDPGCSGNNGEISITGSGGQAPYTFMWDDLTMGGTRTGLGPGMYAVTMTDNAMCTKDTIFTLDDSDGDLDITAGILQTIECPGDMNGSISVQVNASGTFNYMWSVVGVAGVISIDQTVTNLPAGEYAVVVVDPVQNCTAFDTVLLAQPEILSLELSNEETPECKDSPNGSLAVMAIGGISPYTFVWDDNSTSNVRPAIASGTYCVTVTDNNLCTFDSCFVLDPPPPVLLDVISVGIADCNGVASASIEVLASGGNNPSFTNFGYIILEQDLTTVVLNTSGPGMHTITDVPSGTYFVVATDLICTSDPVMITVTEPEIIDFDPNAEVITPSCFGFCDGMISGAATGGTGPYSYSWSTDPGPVPFIDNLCAGTYYVTITDANNCMHEDSILVTQPDTLVATINSFLTVDISCGNDESGMIAIEHTGGNIGMPFQYSWTDNVSMSNQANGLSAGLYQVTVTDARGCTDSISYVLDSPPAVTADIPMPALPDCFGGSTCIAVENVAGGIGGPYSFSVNNGLNNPIDTCIDVIAGQYLVQVFDNVGCGFDTIITIDQPNPLEVEFGSDFIEVELGDTSVILTANISNPVPLDTIIWTPEDEIECFDFDCTQVEISPSGTSFYEVLVTDINGCTDSDIIEVRVSEDRNVFIPNIFSPDNNGSNDRFTMFFGQGVEEVVYFRIFDRWGNKIYEETNVSITEFGGLAGWDGTFKGRELDPSVFVFDSDVKFIDGRVIKYRGDFVLAR